MGIIFVAMVLYFGTRQLLATLHDLFFYEALDRNRTEENKCPNRQTAQTGRTF